MKIEHEFGRLIVKQKKKGFLVNKPLIETHAETLTGWIDEIDEKVMPLLPKRCVPSVKKVKGEYPYVKKPFKKNGDYCQAVVDWIAQEGTTASDCVGGCFTRIEFVDFDLGSVAQIKDYLLTAGWIPNEWNYSKITKLRTSPKLNKDDDFVGVDGVVGKEVAKRMIYRHRRSQLEGFIKIIRPDGRITADVSGMAPTVRLKHKGIVNIPGGEAIFGHEMREVFIVPKGYRLIGCDAASCQLRMLCHYMGDDEYTHAVVFGVKEDGTDIHSVNMRIAGCRTRGQAKTLIYAILFGAGDAKLASQLGCTLKQAKAMRKRFLDNLPKLKALVAGLKKAYKARGYLIGADGRKIFVRSEHMLLVYLLQSAEAIMMKVATLYASKYCEAYDAYMIAHVHDEFQWEVAEEDSEIVGELLEKSIVKAGEFLNLTVPMAGESEIGMNWRDTH